MANTPIALTAIRSRAVRDCVSHVVIRIGRFCRARKMRSGVSNDAPPPHDRHKRQLHRACHTEPAFRPTWLHTHSRTTAVTQIQGNGLRCQIGADVEDLPPCGVFVADSVEAYFPTLWPPISRLTLHR